MAQSIEKLPFNTGMIRKYTLPISSSPDVTRGRGVLLFLTGDDINSNISTINGKSNIYDYGNTYKRYYLPVRIRGKLATKTINYYDPTTRKNTYKLIKKACPKIKETPIMPLENTNQLINCYFDMSTYIGIYNRICLKMNIMRKISLYWSFMDLVWHSPQTNKYPVKYVLIDLKNFGPWTGDPKVDISNPSYLIYHTLYRFKSVIPDSLKDLTFVLYSDTAVLKVNMVDLRDIDNGAMIYRREVKKVLRTCPQKSITVDATSEEANIIYDEIKSHLAQRYKFIGDAENDDNTESIKVSNEYESEEDPMDVQLNKIDNKVEKITAEILSEVDDENIDDKVGYVDTVIEDRINDDKELIQTMYSVTQKQKCPTKPLSSARDAELRKKQSDIKVSGMTLSDLNQIKSSDIKIPVNDVSASLNTSNKNFSEVKFSNFEKEYNNKVMKHDIMNAFESLNDKSIPMYIRDIKVEDTSTPIDYKETYTIMFEDANRQRHTVKVDIPKFIDDKFMWLGSNKKIIEKQDFLYPVVKVDPITVQIVTNYNKMFVGRYDKKNNASVERLLSIIKKNESYAKYFTVGNTYNANTSYVTTIELDQLATLFTNVNMGDLMLNFNLPEAAAKATTKPESGKLYIGTEKGKPVIVDSSTGRCVDGRSIVDTIVDNMPDEMRNDYLKTKSPKRVTYTTVTIMSQTIPFIVLLSYWEGLTTVMKKAKINYEIVDKRPSLSARQNYIQFSDCFLVYDDSLGSGLLMNGLKILDTENYPITEFDEAEPYINYFIKVYGKSAITGALINAYEFTIDPITKEVLRDIGLPEDLVELCIYANNLLADNAYTFEGDQRLYRIRSNEIIAAILYKEISNKYVTYRNSGGKKRFSIPRDAVIKTLLAQENVKDYSTLNPGTELTESRVLTCKGFKGSNVQEAYNLKRRSYPNSMLGVSAISTPSDGNVGVTKHMALEPTVTNVRGYCDLKYQDPDSLKDVNLLSPDELMYPIAGSHDDPTRICMASKQTNHIVPTTKMQSALICNGMEEAVRFNLSTDYVVNAKMDGKVIEVDDKNKMIVVEYKDGTHQVLDLSSNIVKNGGGGFFMNNKKISNLKVGDKFKKNDLLAWHEGFFTNDEINGPRLKIGSLQKVAITTSYATYEDSTFITDKLAHDCATSMTFRKDIVIGKNSNLEYIIKVGDHVEVGDTLLQFDTSYEDSELNKLLKNIGEDLQEEVLENSKNNVKSKYAGEVVDIKIYSPVPLEELSPSLQKLVGNYYKGNKSKYNKIKSYATDEEKKSVYACGVLMTDPVDKVEPNRFGVIRGEKVGTDNIKIEVYIEHGDVMGVGDKLAYFAALKGTIGEVIPKGLEPYTTTRPDEQVSATIASNSILKRMVPSIILNVLGNKVLVELKRKLKEIYES